MIVDVHSHAWKFPGDFAGHAKARRCRRARRHEWPRFFQLHAGRSETSGRTLPPARVAHGASVEAEMIFQLKNDTQQRI
jgi:hypothetical protein